MFGHELYLEKKANLIVYILLYLLFKVRHPTKSERMACMCRFNIESGRHLFESSLLITKKLICTKLSFLL